MSPLPCTCPMFVVGDYFEPCLRCRQMSTWVLPSTDRWASPPLEPEPISDEDIERIAKRVAELLRDLI